MSVGTGTSAEFNGVIFESFNGFNWNYSVVEESINTISSNDYELFMDFTGSTNLIKKTFAVGNSGYLITNHTIQNLSINESDLFEVEIYPNPVIDEITIEVEDANSWDIEILDNSMREMRIDVYSTSSKKKLNSSTLPAGIYYLILTKGSQEITKTIVKK